MNETIETQAQKIAKLICDHHRNEHMEYMDGIRPWLLTLSYDGVGELHDRIGMLVEETLNE